MLELRSCRLLAGYASRGLLNSVRVPVAHRKSSRPSPHIATKFCVTKRDFSMVSHAGGEKRGIHDDLLCDINVCENVAAAVFLPPDA